MLLLGFKWNAEECNLVYLLKPVKNTYNTAKKFFVFVVAGRPRPAAKNLPLKAGTRVSPLHIIQHAKIFISRALSREFTLQRGQAET